MSVQDLHTEATAQAINSAMEAGLIVRCPLHHSELVALGSEEVLPASIPADIRGLVRQLLASHPTSCPRCADESE